ncbi:hypothetical protein C9141_09115 [Escherichia coli]|nr:hypothetical protein C9141_09115 [Escherichia coli]
MNDRAKERELHTLFRYIISCQKSGRLDPTRASKEWEQVFGDYEADQVGCVMAEVIFRLTKGEIL